MKIILDTHFTTAMLNKTYKLLSFQSLIIHVMRISRVNKKILNSKETISIHTLSPHYDSKTILLISENDFVESNYTNIHKLVFSDKTFKVSYKEIPKKEKLNIPLIALWAALIFLIFSYIFFNLF